MMKLQNLRLIKPGNQSRVFLYYYIHYEKLVIVKKYNSIDFKNLSERKIHNYEVISHPFAPKFYGTIKNENLLCPVIEFINGKTLLDTDFSQFSEAKFNKYKI